MGGRSKARWGFEQGEEWTEPVVTERVHLAPSRGASSHLGAQSSSSIGRLRWVSLIVAFAVFFLLLLHPARRVVLGHGESWQRLAVANEVGARG